MSDTPADYQAEARRLLMAMNEVPWNEVPWVLVVVARVAAALERRDRIAELRGQEIALRRMAFASYHTIDVSILMGAPRPYRCVLVKDLEAEAERLAAERKRLEKDPGCPERRDGAAMSDLVEEASRRVREFFVAFDEEDSGQTVFAWAYEHPLRADDIRVLARLEKESV